MNNYIKLNNNQNHLSLGNLLSEIKKISKNKSSAIQTEIFCLLFNIDEISETTVNNYCTGYRAIGSAYKQIYLNYKKNYHKDNNVLVENINNILSVIDGYIHNYQTINELNQSTTLKKLVNNLHILTKNDIYVPNQIKKEILNEINKSNYYQAITKMIFFIVLEKKQPLYESELVLETIEEILKNTNISINDLKKYLSIQFKEGISLIPTLKKLAKEKNPYALHELGNLEYNGLIAGYPRYEESYKYHLEASSFNHPTSYWMLSHLIINKKIGSLTDDDINTAWTYLNKAISLNSISALNTIGICYLHGYNPKKEINLEKAISYFKKATKENYVYAFNNLGKIEEQKGNFEEALNYFLSAATQEESWACNKVAEYYRQGIHTKKNLKEAFNYYNIGANSPINNRCPWNIHNLVKYYYLPGNAELGIKKDLEKSISLLEQNKDFEQNHELLLYAYYELYLNTKNESQLNKVKYYLSIINNNILSNKEYKQSIEQNLNNIYKYKININL